MNELDLTTKIEGLKKAIKEHKDFAGNYESELTRAEQELKDINKPVLTPAQLDDIQEAVEEAIGNYSFDDTDNYEVEYGLEYDGKVYLETINLQSSYELVEKIVNKVHGLFKEADCPDDELDTTEPDNHPVEKLQQ